MSYTVYGLKNCDSCRKAMRWLADQGMDVQLHDLRQDGLSDRMLKAWLDGIGAEALVNRRSTTWRELDEDMRQKALGPGAETVLLAHPTLIKRPLIQINGQWHSGFSPRKYETLFAGSD